MLTLIQGEFERFLDEDDGQPIVMLNLLRFHADGGRERYADDLAAADPLVARYGAEIVTVGDGLPRGQRRTGGLAKPWRSCAIPPGKPSPAWSPIPTTAKRLALSERRRSPRPCCSPSAWPGDCVRLADERSLR